ncbi:hypothetical protein D3C76_1278940 [compost metagenome]
MRCQRDFLAIGNGIDFGEGDIKRRGIFHFHTARHEAPLQFFWRVIGYAAQALRAIEQLHTGSEGHLQEVFWRGVGSCSGWCRGNFQHVQPEQRFFVLRQRRSGQRNAQRLAAVGLNTADRRRNNKRSLAVFWRRFGVALIDPGLDQRRGGPIVG